MDLNLKYKVNQDEGNAKFDKTKKTLTIKLPVVGLTEDSQRVADKHYAEFLEMEKKQQQYYENLEMSTLQEDADKQRMKKSKPGYGAQEEAAAEAAIEARAN